MNELEIITEDSETITLELSKDKNKLFIQVDDTCVFAGVWLNLSQAKQIANFLNQVL